MRLCRKFAVAVSCAGLLVTTSFAAKKEEKPKSTKDKTEKSSSKKDKDKGKGKGTDSTEQPASDDDKGKISLPLLKGHDAFGLKIPYRNTEGKLQMVYNIGQASRVDENRVSMTNMQLETYDDEGKPEMSIDLPVSVLDLSTRVITTDTKVTIKRSDFELTGHSMEFNTETRQGKIGGNVRMLIYDLSGETASGGKDEKTVK